MDTDWSLTWALLSAYLVRELPPECLPDLRVAFQFGGATSIQHFFNDLNGRGVFAGPNAKQPIERLIGVLEPYAGVEAVAKLNASAAKQFQIKSALVSLKRPAESVIDASVIDHLVMEASKQISVQANPVMDRETFKVLWQKIDAQYATLKQLLDHYLVALKAALNHRSVDSILTRKLVDSLVKLTVDWLPRRRYLNAMSYVQEKLKPYQVFLSHTGKQKSSYATWVEKELVRNDVQVFFDERSLKAADDPDINMINAAMTCQVAVVVVSPEYMQEWWPLLELCIFAARLERKAELQKLPMGEKLTDDELLDLRFELLPDFYSPDRGADWVNELSRLPTPFHTWPTGVRLEQKLDDDHAEVVVARTLELLKYTRLAPVKLDLVIEFQKLYNIFQEKRDACWKIAQFVRGDESDLQYSLRLVKWYEPHKRTGNDIDTTMDAARKAGRDCLKLVFTGHTFQEQCGIYLLKQGYSEVANVYFFTAPLDALNWKVMKKPQYDDVQFTNWCAVVGLNEVAEDIHRDFLASYASVRNKLRDKRLQTDPFPSEDMNELLSSILGTRSVPASIKECVQKVKEQTK